MAKRALVTLLTDFGLADPYAAAMKGMILQSCPTADILDITHDIPPHQIMSGAFVLAGAAPYFPIGTLHVVVVDPGVGTDRAILIGQFGGQVFIFPDNGIITFIKEVLPLEGLVVVRNFNFLPEKGICPVFHGRDLFAPLAGQILSGADIAQFGPTPSRYKLLELPATYSQEKDLIGQVIHVDRFGNLISNITERNVRERWGKMESLQVDCQAQRVGFLAGTYGLVGQDTSLALFNSTGYVELAVNQGRACDVFKAGLGAEVRIRETEFLDA